MGEAVSKFLKKNAGSAKKQPVLKKDDTNLTDTNGARGAMDEDGDLSYADDGDGDESPSISSMSVKTHHLPGHKEAQTDIVATLHTSTGVQSKRIVVPGGVTAAKLAALLAGVTNW